jgi:hypothetical protein
MNRKTMINGSDRDDDDDDDDDDDAAVHQSRFANQSETEAASLRALRPG